MIDTTLQTDDTAVSPAIGVVLMVMMTVLLAAIIGTFALGFADTLDDPAPTVYLTYSYDATAENVTISHEAGNSMASDRVYVRVDGVGQAAWHEGDPGVDPGDDVRVGRTFDTAAAESLSGPIEPGTTVRVVWATNGSSTTLRSWEVG